MTACKICVSNALELYNIFARRFLGKEYKTEIDNTRNGMGLGGMNSKGQGSEKWRVYMNAVTNFPFLRSVRHLVA